MQVKNKFLPIYKNLEIATTNKQLETKEHEYTRKINNTKVKIKSRSNQKIILQCSNKDTNKSQKGLQMRYYPKTVIMQFMLSNLQTELP